MSNRKKYIIYSIDYDEEIGGIIALHHLCHLLNEAGENAYIWNPYVWHVRSWTSYNNHILRRTSANAKRMLFKLIRKRLGTNPNFNTPTADVEDLATSIVVYPEIVSGNPLQSENVVRWFLNKPGIRTGGEINYGANELYYFYNPQFNDTHLNPCSARQLKTLYIRDDIYYQTNKAERSGSCYILRKGRGRRIVHDLSDSVLIDSLSHEEKAKTFNRVKYCISYDTYTMFSKYAAMCGCLSIVIPEENVTKEQWRPNVEDRYGIAYGFNDLKWAEETQHLVLDNLKAQANSTQVQLKKFVEKTQSYFAHR